MTFSFRPAVRENVGLLIGLSGGTGSGKTYSAMRLAQGIAGAKRFAVIDTEAGRANHYADEFKFDHGDLQPPFRPGAYADAIKAADDAGYPVIVVDSASHEHAGTGGLLDWHDEELDRMAGQDWKKREACKMAAWIKPKTEHKAFVNRLLQVRAHLILCFRAEEKIEMQRDANGKMQIVPKKSPVGLDGWLPICEKNLPYEMTASFLLLASKPGIPLPIKLQNQHRALFGNGEPLSEQIGAGLAEWARGGSSGPASSPAGKAASPAAPSGPANPPAPCWIMSNGQRKTFGDIDAWRRFVINAITEAPIDGLPPARERNGSVMAEMHAYEPYAEHVMAVQAAFTHRLEG